jgi:GSH-dependent disulfide-bond oxidoreductase
MIDCYMAATTNSRRASVGLSEAGLAYTAHAMNLREKDQQKPEHLARNPYGKVPVIVDSDGPGGKSVTIFESGAILLYAAEKSGKLYGKDALERIEVQKWFMLHMNGSVPFLGALKNHPTLKDDCARVVKVIDSHLAKNQFFAGSFSIADVCFFPRVFGFDQETFPINDFKNIVRWIDEVAARPATKEGMSQPK